MYGFINTCLKSLVTEKFGEESWERLSCLAGVQDTFMTYEVYDDIITMRLVKEACSMLDLSSEVVLKLFGEHFFSFCKQSGYDTMLRTLGGNLTQFIQNLDTLHSYLSLSYQDMNAPSFRVEKSDNGNMLLHYYSDRKGLYHIVPGIMEAVARDLFSSEVSMTVINQSKKEEESEEEEERTGKKEHVVFLVTQTIRETPQKNKEVSQGSVEERCSSASLCPTDPLQGSFRPCYPDRLWMEVETFCQAFPFHIVFDKDLKVKQTGVTIQRFVPELQTKDIKLDQYFTIVHPQVTFTVDSIRKFINSQFVMKTLRDMSQHTTLKLRGQMVWVQSLGCMLYLCSPKLRSLQDLEERGLHLADIAPHDVTRDLVLLNQQRLAEMELTNQLERKKEELRILSRHLEAEKKKTETLLYAMLPRHIANQLKEGKTVEAGEFEVCTILFSDVVTFTNICSSCEPIRIVHMLNSLYSRFDRLTSVHDVYKVETIGDAYMVVGGVPVPIESHAHRVANFALGMRIAAREVANPVTGEPIHIRVGLHTGSVLAGVVGEKMPRYCLFGDTVNTASRMESHGLPDHIHISDATHSVLKEASFDLRSRGQIEVKGKGQMTTYFLLGNLHVSEERIMGRDGGGGCMYPDQQQKVAAVDPQSENTDTETNGRRDTPSAVAAPQCGAPPPHGDTPSTVAAPPVIPYVWDVTEPCSAETELKSQTADINTRFCLLL